MADIEYFYAAHSAYAYLGSRRLFEMAKGGGHRIVHKPFDLRKLLPSTGSPPIAKRTKAHIDYYFGREIERWSEHRNAPVMKGTPTHHDNDITLPNCVLIAALYQGINIDELSHVFLEAHWRDDADLADRATLEALVAKAGLPPAPLLDEAGSETVRGLYDEHTNEAIARSVFGSPTYFVDNDMFYGQDHLEMVKRALVKPYA